MSLNDILHLSEMVTAQQPHGDARLLVHIPLLSLVQGLQPPPHKECGSIKMAEPWILCIFLWERC